MWERSFLRNLFVICEFISPSFSFPLKKAFGKTVLGDFRATVKRKYFQIKTGKKLFEKLLCVLLIHLTDLPLKKPFTKTVLAEFAKWYFAAQRGLRVKKKISSVKKWKKAFWKTALCSVNSSHRFTPFPARSGSLRLFLWNLQSDIWKYTEG